jgi:hypothetical protein
MTAPRGGEDEEFPAKPIFRTEKFVSHAKVSMIRTFLLDGNGAFFQCSSVSP